MAMTHEISVREFRQNLSLYLHAAKTKKMHFVVMRHLEPIAEFGPPKKKKKTQQQLREELIKTVLEAEAQIDRGEWYTSKEIRNHLGLPPSPYSGRRRRAKN